MARLYIASLLLVATALTTLVGCGGGSESSTVERPTVRALSPQYEKTLRINLSKEPQSIDPTIGVDVVGGNVLHGLFEPLVYMDKEGDLHPRAAVSWMHSDDYLTWTFHLRPEARWHNGDPVTAHDYVYALKRISTPASNSSMASMVYVFLKEGREYYEAGGWNSDREFVGAEVIDDYTLQFNLANPTPFFLSVIQLFSFYPVHQATIEAHGERWALSPRTYVGMGPFRLAKLESKSVYTLEKADTYWGKDEIFWDRVEFYMIESAATENEAFLSGDLDVTAAVSVPELDFWRNKPEYNENAFFGTYMVGFQKQNPPFDNLHVRRAFSLAIDRSLIVNRVTRKGEIVAQGLIPPINSPRGGMYRDHAGDMIGAHDPEAARAAFAEAGYGPNGKTFPTVEYMYDTNDLHKAIAEQLQAMWRQHLGVDVRLQQVDWSQRVTRARSGDYQIGRINWFGDYIDPMTFLDLYISNSSWNDLKYVNEKYDELVEAARRETDAVKREDLMIAAEKLLVETDAAVAPLFYFSEPTLIRTGIEGIGSVPTGGLIWNRSRRVSLD